MTDTIKNPGGLANFNHALQYVKIFDNREDFGLRWQSAAATPLFDYGQSFQSGMAPALRDSRRSPKKMGRGYAALRLCVKLSTNDA